MNIRTDALKWLKRNFPTALASEIRSSKHYVEGELWFLTLPTEFITGKRSGALELVLQQPKSSDDFLLLRIPYTFLAERASEFDIRADGQSFDLHISSKPSSWLRDLRGRGTSFASFVVEAKD